jgi:hypothetical protein
LEQETAKKRNSNELAVSTKEAAIKRLVVEIATGAVLKSNPNRLTMGAQRSQL